MHMHSLVLIGSLMVVVIGADGQAKRKLNIIFIAVIINREVPPPSIFSIAC